MHKVPFGSVPVGMVFRAYHNDLRQHVWCIKISPNRAFNMYTGGRSTYIHDNLGVCIL